MIGLRRASAAEADLLREWSIRTFTMEDVDELGVREVMRRSLAAVQNATRGFVLCMHVSVAENTFPGDRGRGGLNYRECSQAMEMIATSGGLRAVCLTGVPEGTNSEALVEFLEYLLSLFGRRILSGSSALTDALNR